MKSFLIKTLVILSLFSAEVNFAQSSVSPDDLIVIAGEWKGNLTYVDYGTGNPFTMPANVMVSSGNNKYQAQLLFTYPNEPNANSKDKIRISKDGLQINKAEVVSRIILANNDIEITTEYQGKDNNKKALIRAIYVLGSERFIIRKEVKFDSEEEWLMRNEYSFSR